VIGYEFWDRRFGRDPGVIGKVIRIEGTPFTIVGVSRRWFMGMTPGTPPEIAIPLTAAPSAVLTTNRSSLWIFIYWTAEGRCHHRASSRTITVVLA